MESTVQPTVSRRNVKLRDRKGGEQGGRKVLPSPYSEGLGIRPARCWGAGGGSTCLQSGRRVQHLLAVWAGGAQDLLALWVGQNAADPVLIDLLIVDGLEDVRHNPFFVNDPALDLVVLVLLVLVLADLRSYGTHGGQHSNKRSAGGRGWAGADAIHTYAPWPVERLSRPTSKRRPINARRKSCGGKKRERERECIFSSIGLGLEGRSPTVASLVGSTAVPYHDQNCRWLAPQQRSAARQPPASNTNTPAINHQLRAVDHHKNQ